VATPITLVLSDAGDAAVVERMNSLLSAAGAEVDLQRFDADDGQVTPALVDAIRRTGVGLMGFQWGRRNEGKAPPIVQLRRDLGIQSNVRPIRSLPGVDCVFDDVDLLIVREVTEDVYAQLEHESLPGVFESLKVTTRTACERIARVAFELARAKRRKKVTTVHKSNIMKHSDGLFLRVSQEVAKEYPDIEHDEVIVDALCMKLVLTPQKFDVLLCGNLFGDIVGDLAAGLTGGAVNTPSINLGADVAVFTVGQRGPRLGGSDALPMLLSSLYMLEHIGQRDARRRLGRAAEAAVLEGVRPQAIGGPADTNQYFDAVIERLGRA
jgi:isocitrate dehydrogenase (NAD+)